MPEVMDLLERYTFFEVLLCVIGGKNYSSAIAKTLKKSQPTVTEQLTRLRATQIIKALNRGNAQTFEVNWELLFEIFYNIVYQTVTVRKECFQENEIKRLTRASLEGIVPRSLFKDFLREYYYTFRDSGGKKKGFDEIIFSFFLALAELDKADWKKIINQYGIDGDILATVSNALGFEVYGIEQTALIMLPEVGQEPKVDKA